MYPYVHPVSFYHGKKWDIPSLFYLPHACMYVRMHVSLCSSRPIVPWEKMGHTQSVPFTTCMHVCMYPYGHPVPLYHGKEWDVPRSVPFTTCMYVCMHPYVHHVPLYHGDIPSLSHLSHACMYPSCPIVPWKRMRCTSVCPIYHVHVCMNVCPSCPIVPWKRMAVVYCGKEYVWFWLLCMLPLFPGSRIPSTYFSVQD